MNKEKVILFGASKLGKIAKLVLEDTCDILFYIDNDIRKVGSYVDGIEIVAIDKLTEVSENIKIIISSTFYKEIIKQLDSIGIKNYQVFSTDINLMRESTALNDYGFKVINLGKLFHDIPKLSLRNMTFLPSGSGALDYLFLRALAIKFEIKTYLEIGSFIGESMDAVADIIDKGISISLPDNDTDYYFKGRKMKNFASYFLYKNPNITQYKEDSKTFDYSEIKDKIDMVFIDGDHSYEGVYNDTKNISNFVDMEDTIIVWHDFIINGAEFRVKVIDATLDALDKKYHKNIFFTDNTACGVYFPDKYLDQLAIGREEDELYAYEVNFKVKKYLHSDKNTDNN